MDPSRFARACVTVTKSRLQEYIRPTSRVPANGPDEIRVPGASNKRHDLEGLFAPQDLREPV